MLDDDLVHCYCLTGAKTRRMDPQETLEVLINCYIMANDLGVSVFGFWQTDIRKYNGTEPFGLFNWVGGVIGIIGKHIKFEGFAKVDIDACLQGMLRDRVLFQDRRFLFSQNRDNNTGGSSMFKTKEKVMEEVEKLINKWGAYVRLAEHKKVGQMKVSLSVPRRGDLYE